MAYDKKYWKYQKQIGQNLFHSHFVSEKFIPEIKPSDKVLDFGCGGGFVLNSFNCKKKFGIEINSHAQKQAKSFGITVVESFDDLKSKYFDIVISNSALEHINNPLEILVQSHRVLKKNGKLIFSVPHEDLSYNFQHNDINQHLYTWSPMSFGNLIQKAGFKILKVVTKKIITPPFAYYFYRLFGLKGYKLAGKLYRALRKLFIPIKRMGVTGDIIVYAIKE